MKSLLGLSKHKYICIFSVKVCCLLTVDWKCENIVLAKNLTLSAFSNILFVILVYTFVYISLCINKQVFGGILTPRILFIDISIYKYTNM